MWLVLQAWPERAEGWAVQDLTVSQAEAAERITYLRSRADFLQTDTRYATTPVVFPPHPGPRPATEKEDDDDA